MSNLPPLEPFNLEGAPSAQASKWKTWLERLDVYFVATEIAEDRRRAVLLHLAGPGMYKLSRTLTELAPNTYATLVDALNQYFEPMANQDYERFVFRQARQEPE